VEKNDRRRGEHKGAAVKKNKIRRGIIYYLQKEKLIGWMGKSGLIIISMQTNWRNIL